MALSFENFDLRLERSGERYRAYVLASPAGEVVEESALPPGFFDLEEFLKRIGRPSRGMFRDARHSEAVESKAGEALSSFGANLFEVAFPGQVGTALENSLKQVRDNDAGLRIRLRLADVPELVDLPWEYLYNPATQTYVTLSAEVCLTRYPELLRSEQPLAVTPPLQVLVVIANPSDLTDLDVEAEWESLKEAVAKLEEEERIEICRLEDATLEALQGALRRDDYHILHFIGHGDFDTREKKGILVLEDKEGRSHRVPTEDLNLLLGDEVRNLRLVVLNTCKGARTSESDPFAGLAQGLLRQGVPAVVAMQFEISDQAAITFSREFYRSVADGFPIDFSVGEGRKAIRLDDDLDDSVVEWGIPVLFMRSDDGYIFKVVEEDALPVRPLAAWQAAAWRFATRHRLALSGAVVAQIALAVAFFALRDRYLISPWRWALAALLALAAVAGWSWWQRTRPVSLRLAPALLATVGLLALLGWQGSQIVWPRPFAVDLFGIAVAELGEGPGYRRTPRARELSNQVYEYLCQEVKRQFPGESCEEGGGGDAGREPTRVALRRVGVMPDSRAAERYARRVGADVIIWGQASTAEEGGVNIYFRLLDTQDRAVSPQVPLVLPVTSRTADSYRSDLDLDSAQVKEVIAQQSSILASFAFGLESFYDLYYPQAAAHFETVVQTLERGTPLEISRQGKSLFYFYLGRAYQGLGEIEQGQEWLERAGQQNSIEPAVPMALALGHGSLGQEEERDARLDEALALTTNWLRTHPDDNTAHYDRGMIYEIKREYEDALIDFREVIRRDPEYYVAYISLAVNASKLGRDEESIEALEEAIQISDRSGANPGWAHLNLALIYEKLGRFDEARTEYQAAIEATESGWMYYSYGQFLEARGETDAALEAYQGMARVSPDPGWAYGKLADFLRRQGDLTRARDAYKTAVHYRPEDPLLRAYLGEVYFELGRAESEAALRQGYYDDSREEFEQAIQLGPELYYVFSSYGNVLFQMGDLEAAAASYERSLELRPLDGGVLLNLGWAYELLERPGEAEATYRRIVSQPEAFGEGRVQEACKRLRGLGVEDACPEQP
ncbi:MAG: tetratricopeptide repeat protein [Anaerolineae bacterium]